MQVCRARAQLGSVRRRMTDTPPLADPPLAPSDTVAPEVTLACPQPLSVSGPDPLLSLQLPSAPAPTPPVRRRSPSPAPAPQRVSRIRRVSSDTSLLPPRLNDRLFLGSSCLTLFLSQPRFFTPYASSLPTAKPAVPQSPASQVLSAPTSPCLSFLQRLTPSPLTGPSEVTELVFAACCPSKLSAAGKAVWRSGLQLTLSRVPRPLTLENGMRAGRAFADRMAA